MPPYLFPLPTTSLLTFSSILHDPSGTYTTTLSDATAARTKLHLALKAVSTNDVNSSALSVLDAIHEYLPYLRGIISSLDSDILLYKTDPLFQWRSSLTSYSLTTPLLPFPSMHAEHLFVMLTYSLALVNHAHHVLNSLPKFEPPPGQKASMTSEEEKRTTAGLAKGVDLLSQAAGVMEWTAGEVVPLVEMARVAAGGRIGKGRWPVECGSETMRGLAMIFLADAHITAIRKLLLPILPHTLFAPPGPPLPPNHPSPSLLAKLYLHVASLYSSARQMCKAHSDPPTNRKLFSKSSEVDTEAAEGELIPPVKRYLRKESLLASALGYKWLGVDCGENGKGEKVGEALALLIEAKGRLEEMEDGKIRERMKGLSVGKGSERKKEERRGRKGRLERELEDVGAYIKAYKGINDTVAFQPIPPISSLNIPPGRPIFAAKKFTPPPAKLGADSESNGDITATHDTEYAGKGSYF
ncbi:hypothetical protein TREMEDRAFT_33779 [Tremella mesenterica DSM 1558]|uniref:uncharacterized protein n=1 Tax=Tremella mesenterica (strain ATCC 24925 / CBS 8224 / DSM 1558 / NBRC 9311 / NRRL Y-6157 / RJB 2259-6 / UBC 559-6) TaxID=578456 RepID=UPI0003F49816|nr:uncharacterized protein TREMEDRAFT_33779 [Tremella mesenterica DSM 1558]EIW67251.1 hypothetical protein TREMEDRAFT_33779 [Tremella mesenterica DSM 1558]